MQPTDKAPEVSRPERVNSGITKQERVRTAQVYHVLLLGVAIQVGGFFGGWNYMYAGGIWQMLIATIYMSAIYILLTFSLAEISSAVPFAGGSFGYVRCSLGPFVGYLVGASELLQNIIYVVACMELLGYSLSEVFKTSHELEPLYVIALYVIMSIVQCADRTVYWTITSLTGILTVLIILVYLISSSTAMNFDKYALDDRDMKSGFTGGFDAFVHNFFFVTFFYIGIEIAPLSCDEVIDVKKNLPRGMVSATCISAVLAIPMIFICASVYPGVSEELATAISPLIFGFEYVLKIPHRWSVLLGVIPTFTSCLGFFYGCGHQMHALANSGILPPILKHTVGAQEQPLYCYIFTTAVQFIVYLLLHYWIKDSHIYQLCAISASTVYSALFAAYIVFKTRFSGLTREFESPFGVAGAGLGILLCAAMWVMMVFMQGIWYEAVSYAVYMFLAFVFYLAYAKKHQFFSKEEQKKFMKAYILNANTNKKKGKNNNNNKQNNNASTGRNTSLTPQKLTLLQRAWHVLYYINNVVLEVSSSKKSKVSPDSAVHSNKSNHDNHANSQSNNQSNDQSNKSSQTTSNSSYSSSNTNNAIMNVLNAFAKKVAVKNNLIAPSDKETLDSRLPAPASAPALTTTTPAAAAVVGGSAKCAASTSSKKREKKARQLSLQWSGKFLNERESQRLFEIIHDEEIARDPEALRAEILQTLPDKFQSVVSNSHDHSLGGDDDHQENDNNNQNDNEDNAVRDFEEKFDSDDEENAKNNAVENAVDNTYNTADNIDHRQMAVNDLQVEDLLEAGSLKNNA